MRHRLLFPIGLLCLGTLVASCGGASSSSSTATTLTETAASPAAATPTTFRADVWADNWFSLYANGTLVGQDSVPITTVRSFNAETITFTATYPVTIAMVSKDYVENESGLEYIGTDRQQMGDGGFIAQFTDTTTGKVVAATGADWKGLVIFRAPLNPDCVKAADPMTTCQHEILPEPDGWTSPSFDDTGWLPATTYTEAEVGTQGDYTTISWSPVGALIWSSSLKVDNTILWRHTVSAP
ncbi:MAG: PEBP family protein [Actinomycetes bacterium]